MTGVAVTGYSALCAAGRGKAALWKAMLAARPIPLRPARDPAAGAGLVLPPCHGIPEDDLPEEPREAIGLPVGRSGRAALAAARMAVRDAGLDPARTAGCAVLLASGVAEAALPEDWRFGASTPPDRWVPSFAAAAVLGDELGAGTVSALGNACAGSSYALSLAADLIRSGEADVVVAGGVETWSRVTAASFARLGAIDPDGCRPFHRERRGTGLGEGAAVLVLESEEHARAREAKVYARLVGSGWSSDAYHATAPDPSGEQSVRALREALREAGAGPDDVGLAVPHATGTELSDATESRALHQVFGPRAAQLPLYSLKALLSHTGGASGALSAVAALLILEHGFLPPNLPVTDQDPECDVLLPTSPVPVPGRFALTNAFAFGGHNISLLFQDAS